MKRSLAPLAMLALPFSTIAQDLPAASPAATVTQRVGLTDVTITYSRPSAKGRKIFGDLVPLGELWRTGANQVTLIDVSGPILLAGKQLNQGKYALLTIPGQDEWDVVINAGTDMWGTDGYREDKDLLRVKARTRSVSMTETFTIGFENLASDEAELVFRWETTEAYVSIKADATEQGLKNIRAALEKPDADYRAFARSASFCLDRGIESKEALGWARKSVDREKKYWNTFTLARAQAANGMTREAIQTGKEAITLAVAEKDGGAVKSYQAMVDEWSGGKGK